MAAEQLDASAGCTVDVALKDLAFICALGGASQVPLHVADATFHSLQAAAANGYGSADVGALLAAVQQAAGLMPPGKRLGDGN